MKDSIIYIIILFFVIIITLFTYNNKNIIENYVRLNTWQRHSPARYAAIRRDIAKQKALEAQNKAKEEEAKRRDERHRREQERIAKLSPKERSQRKIQLNIEKQRLEWIHKVQREQKEQENKHIEKRRLEQERKDKLWEQEQEKKRIRLKNFEIEKQKRMDEIEQRFIREKQEKKEKEKQQATAAKVHAAAKAIRNRQIKKKKKSVSIGRKLLEKERKHKDNIKWGNTGILNKEALRLSRKYQANTDTWRQGPRTYCTKEQLNRFTREKTCPKWWRYLDWLKKNEYSKQQDIDMYKDIIKNSAKNSKKTPEEYIKHTRKHYGCVGWDGDCGIIFSSPKNTDTGTHGWKYKNGKLISKNGLDRNREPPSLGSPTPLRRSSPSFTRFPATQPAQRQPTQSAQRQPTQPAQRQPTQSAQRQPTQPAQRQPTQSAQRQPTPNYARTPVRNITRYNKSPPQRPLTPSPPPPHNPLSNNCSSMCTNYGKEKGVKYIPGYVYKGTCYKYISDSGWCGDSHAHIKNAKPGGNCTPCPGPPK